MEPEKVSHVGWVLSNEEDDDPDEECVDPEELSRDIERGLEAMIAWNRGESRMRVTRFIDDEPVVSYETRPEAEAMDEQRRSEREIAVKRYAIEIRWAGNNYSAHCPDVPGVIVTGATLEEVQQRFREALEFHFEGLREDGLPIPEPLTLVATVDIAA